MNIKKLIASAVFALGAWMSVGLAMAQTTNYDFNFTGNNGSVSGVFGVNGNIITNITGTVTGNSLINGPITGLTTFAGNDNIYSPSAPYLNSNGVSFIANGVSLNLFNAGRYVLIGFPGNSSGPMTSSISSAGVPEIDGALAPKVGFVLACLFLIFGRKQENTESLMTA